MLRLLHFIETSEDQQIEIAALFWRILRNLAIDQHRSARRAAAIHDYSVLLDQDAELWRLPPAACDTHAQLAARQELAAVRRRVAHLPEAARTLFAERFIEECSYREIARRLDITEALARKRVQKLRALIAEPAPDAEEDDPSRSQKCPPHVYHHEAA
jgi:RNA polymerase sigma factor (sigma-70 family)